MAQTTPLILNRQALRDFHVETTYEAGISLFGKEVKSIREGKVNLKGSFARFEGMEVFLYNMHINPYAFASDATDPIRPRKLLLNKSELRALWGKVTLKGYTLVPLKVYFKKSYVKVELALARGKDHADRREAIKEKESKREIDRIMKQRRG